MSAHLTKSLERATAAITRHFDGLSTRVFRRTELSKCLAAHRAKWEVAESVTTSYFITFLQKIGRLQRITFPFTNPYKREVRYSWGPVPLHAAILSLKSGSYFSHYTAMRFHGFTEQVPKIIYVNFEQASRSIPTGTLSQASIDSAFRRKPRTSRYIAEVESIRVCVINGKNTGNLGVVEMEIQDGESITTTARITNPERTLIDITVRPAYSGGVAEVMKAFRLAKGQISVNRLSAMLKEVGHIYPYHQAVGFYLERAGYKPAALDLLRRFPIAYDFYLAHQIEKTDYVRDWRLFVPQGL